MGEDVSREGGMMFWGDFDIRHLSEKDTCGGENIKVSTQYFFRLYDFPLFFYKLILWGWRRCR